MVKCIICNENLNRSYVRISIKDKNNKIISRKWKAVGYFCRNDKIFISDKDFPKYILNLKPKIITSKKSKNKK